MLPHAGPAAAFLGHRRLALVGVSRDPAHFSRQLFRDLRQRGYDVVPVNPAGEDLDGCPSFRRLQDVHPPVPAALVMTPAAGSAAVVRDCIEAGVRHVWLHRGAGEGAASGEAITTCRVHGLDVVPGACPYMYLPRAGWIHALHGFVHGIVGAR